MASTTLTVITPVLTGTFLGTGPTVVGTGAKRNVGTGQTLTIDPSTAQSVLDLASLHIRVQNTSSTASVSLSLGVGTRFSDIGLGAATITVATNTTIIIGGQGFESSRFQITANTIVFTQTGTGPTSWEAYQAPRASE